MQQYRPGRSESGNAGEKMHPSFARNAIYFPVQRAMGGNLKEAIRLHQSLERQPEESLRKYQEERLRRLLEHAFTNIPFYRDLLGQVDLRLTNPFEILKTLPVLSKSDLREQLPLLVDKRYSSSWRNTSGSTGTPFRFCKDRLSLLHMDAVMNSVYSWHGIEIADRQARIWGRPLYPGQKLTQNVKDLFLNRRRLSAFALTMERCRLFFNLLQKFRPAFLYCYPNAAVLFGSRLEDLGLEPKGLRLKAIVCTSEPLLEQHRRYLAETFGCPVVSEYGNSENGILAMECEHGKAHIMSGNVILEFLNGDNPALPTDLGEVVVTELHSRSIPFIRYRTGDVGGAVLGETCSCGRTLPLMKIACGRDDSFIVRPDGQQIHVAILVYFLKDGVRQFRVIQEALDKLLVQIVPDSAYNEEAERKYQNIFHKYCGDSMRINFVKMDYIPPEKNGKVLYYVSKIGPNYSLKLGCGRKSKSGNEN
jgi:phenylacetate-CoA ligase